MTGRLILGTSGFAYRHWRDRFYPPDVPQRLWLEYYAEHFSAVELNVTFYRLPDRDVFERWAQRTPDDFRFIVKGSRLITHAHRLAGADDATIAFRDATTGLAEKLACVLWQLPPTMPADARRLDDFCSLADRVFSAGLRHAFEFREPSWFDPVVLRILHDHGHALVWADPGTTGQSAEQTAPYAYLRFHHGPRESGAYEPAELEGAAVRAADVIDGGGDAFALFNNDPGGWAVTNARQFRELVAESVVGAARSRVHAGRSLGKAGR